MSQTVPNSQREFPVSGMRRGLKSYWSPFWLSEFRLSDEQLSQPLRFGLGELFAAVTVAAVLLALFRALGIVGAAVSFIAAVAFTNILYPKLNSSLARQETMFDFVWGILMPIVCLAFDPFVFKENDIDLLFNQMTQSVIAPPATSWIGGQVHPRAFPVYGFLGWQLLILCIWLAAGRLPADISAVWAGMLWSGFMVGCVIGGILFVPAMVGIFFVGIGLLGLTPLFTARAYYRRAILAAAIATRELSSPRAERLALLGYWLALPVPMIGLIVVWYVLASL